MCEPITHVVRVMNTRRSSSWHVLFDRVVTVLPDGWFTIEGETQPLDTRDEGIRWIRGYHYEKSEESKALLAAWALNQNRAA